MNATGENKEAARDIDTDFNIRSQLLGTKAQPRDRRL